MIYPEYEKTKWKYNHLQEVFASILLEKEGLFTKALPNAIRYDKDRVQSTVDGNPLEEYVISVEGIDDRLDALRQRISDWEILLECKERQLRPSPDRYDRIYVLRYIDGCSVKRICKILSYSRSQVYKILNQIKKETK